MVVEHLSHQPKVKGLFKATIADTGRTQSFYRNEPSGGSIVVEPLTHQPKTKGLSPFTASNTQAQFLIIISQAGAM